MENRNFDIVIIGGGPAGLAAGIYAARGGLSVAIVENKSVGGQASTAYNIENYPGIKSANGFELCYTMYAQCKDFGCEFVFDSIENCNLTAKTIALSSGQQLDARAIVIATGASARPLGVANEGKYIGKGISYCATCDGGFFKGKTVAVIGGGNTACEDALYLEKLASKVYLIHRRDALRADDILAKRIENSTVQVLWNSVVDDIVGDDKIAQLQLKNTKNGNLTSVLVDGVFVAIGHTPNSSMFENLDVDDADYIITDENMHTSIDGIYAIGDVRHKSLRQVVTACADGAICASEIQKVLG